VLFVTFALGAGARGDDWPQWLGPRRDGVWRETGILDKFPEGGPRVRWRVKVGPGYTGPAVAAGRVYVMDRMLPEGTKNPTEPFPMRPGKGIPGSERVLCLDAADGHLLWKHEYDCLYTVSYPSGPRTTPTVRDGKVYTLGTEGHLFCLDAATGKVAWSHELQKEYGVKAPLWGFAAHPLLDGGKLFCTVGGKGSTVVAFDKDTGKERWRALSAREPGYCPPMIYEAGGKRQLIVWTAESVNGLDPETGTVYWSELAASYMGMSIATPRKEGDRLFLTAYPSLALMLRLAADRPAAEVAWRGGKKTGLYSIFGTPFFEGGYVYGFSNPGRLTCVKAETGERLWETLKPTGGEAAPSADGFLVKNGGRFFVVNEKGDLIIARLSPKGYEEVSRAHLLEPTTSAFNSRKVVWSHPAFANRCAYLRNDRELLCVSLAARQGGE
jgi:outer membrane protein assembly factor BamB